MFSSHDAKITRNGDRDMPPSRDLADRTIFPAGKMAYLQISCRSFCRFLRPSPELIALQAARISDCWHGEFKQESSVYLITLLLHSEHTETIRTTHSAIDKFHYLSYTLRFCIKDATERLNVYYSLFM